MTSLRGLFLRYFEVRESMRAPKTSMPQPEALRQDITVSNPQRARSNMESQKAFVCDVELYLERIEWYDSMLIRGRIAADIANQKSWRVLIKEMNEDGRPFPKRYKDKRGLSELFGKVVKPNAEAYFRDRGYIR
jgi:hypothetical protein